MVIKGMGCGIGVAFGPVKIIHNVQHLEKLEYGDVLVLPTATPDMIIAFKKAVAVVTDAGGVTSHAAIICRELGIPCIIGTEIATKVLNENTIVKVDDIRGIVSEYSQPIKLGVRSSEKPRAIKIFGRKVAIVSLKMDRDKPLWRENWHYNWPELDMNKSYEWIPYRPEVYVEPLASFFLSAIEKGPYIINPKIGPMYARFRNCNIYLRLDKVQEIIALLKVKLLDRDEPFFEDIKRRVHEAYEDLDRITRELEGERHRFITMSSNELLEFFKKWWKINDDFFSLNVLIATMGVDIVWPEIRRMLMELFDDESKVNEYISLLAIPSVDLESTKFFHECFKLVNLSRRVKSILLSNMSPKETLEIIEKLEEGKEWMQDFIKFIDKWGWMRDRLLYFETLTKEEEMIGFLKKHISREAKPSVSERKFTDLDSFVQEISNLLPKKKLLDFTFYLDLGRFLQTERDSRYLFMMKNSNVVRKIFLELGRRLKGNGILYDVKDIFFLLTQEVIELFSPKTTTKRKVEIASKIPNRMNALTYVSKLKLHDHPGYHPGKVPDRDGEFY